MPCHRCRSLIFPVDLLDEAGGLLYQTPRRMALFRMR